MTTTRRKKTQLFAPTDATNQDAARFFRRWLALHDLKWNPRQVFDLLSKDTSMPTEWQQFAAAARLILTPPTYTESPKAKLFERKKRKANKAAKAAFEKKLHEFPETSYVELKDLYAKSPLLTTYASAVLASGNTRESLISLLAVYDFEEQFA
jgi:hypothetical protein